jgi:hypothetical protein
MVHEAVPAPSVAASILSSTPRVAVPEPQPQPTVAPASAEVIEMLQRSAEPRSEPEEEAVVERAVAEEPEAIIEEPAIVEPAPIIEEEREEAIVVATPRIPETPFVAPRAFSVEQQDVMTRADAFVEPAQDRQAEQKKRGPSLFDRLTGRNARGGEERGRREPDFQKTARSAPQQAPARLREEQRLDLGDAGESDYDEQLEIPAFLRRQAN